MVPDAKKTWGGRVNSVTIGATQAAGGTRGYTVTIGGSATLPFLDFEGPCVQPAVAMEICDTTRKSGRTCSKNRSETR